MSRPRTFPLRPLGLSVAMGLLPLCLAAQHGPLMAQTPSKAEPPPPPIMVTGPNDELLEPTVTIRKEAEREVEEYRVRGQLFAIRVKTKGAPAYWLVDPDGSGRMVPGQGIGPTISVPKWVLREF